MTLWSFACAVRHVPHLHLPTFGGRLVGWPKVHLAVWCSDSCSLLNENCFSFAVLYRPDELCGPRGCEGMLPFFPRGSTYLCLQLVVSEWAVGGKVECMHCCPLDFHAWHSHHCAPHCRRSLLVSV